jgi:Zn finger protein HypA/HybF involved in hydrogenase expression
MTLIMMTVLSSHKHEVKIMAYQITCRTCHARTTAGNIAWLLHEKEYHTDKRGNVKCKTCGSTNAHIYRKSQLQEEGEYWERCIEAVIRLADDREASYQPYVFLTMV